MQRRRLLASLFAVSIAGCNDVEPTNGTPVDDGETPDGRVEILDSELVRLSAGTDEETVSIAGRVRIHEPDLQHVEVRGRFFDADEELLDTTFERLQELEVGTRRFSVRFPHDGERAANVAGFDISITTVV